MMNAIGLQSIGVHAFIEEKLPVLRAMKGVVVIANIFGYTIEDCVEVIHILNDAEGIALLRVPQRQLVRTPAMAAGFGTDPDSLDHLSARCRHAAQRPLMVKLSPNVTSIAEEHGPRGAGGRRAGDLAGQHLRLAGHRH